MSWLSEEEGLYPDEGEEQQTYFNITQFLEAQKEWSEDTFGKGMRTEGICNHIRSELLEIERNPGDLEEWIDVLLLAFDGAWRVGATTEHIVAILIYKQRKNVERKWGAILPETEPSFHVQFEECKRCGATYNIGGAGCPCVQVP